VTPPRPRIDRETRLAGESPRYEGYRPSNFNQAGGFDLPPDLVLWRHAIPTLRIATYGVPNVTFVSARSMKRLIFAAAVGAAVVGVVVVGAPAPSNAADLGVLPGLRHVRHLRVADRYWDWRDRCAFAGYYCLYAWDGYVYHYRWDDRPSYAYSSRRHRHRY